MKSLEKNYHNIFNSFLYVLPVSFLFMKLANILVILFVIFNLFFYRKLVYSKQKFIICTVIGLPLLLDLLFFWNNNSFELAIKSTEKHLLFLVFPLIIVGYNTRINLSRLLKFYVALMLIVLTLLFVRYIIVYPEHVSKYLNGVHLWEMGYHFSNSFNNHAPALNMHLAFVSVASFYLLLTLRAKRKSDIVISILLLLLSLFFLLYVNTRVAVVSAVLGYVLTVVSVALRNQNKKNIFKKIIILFVLVSVSIISFINLFPYTVKKFSDKSFAHMDMVGRLDDFENPEAEVFSALVTRVSIWKSALELSNKKLLTGYGASDSKSKLFDYYKETNQQFLYKYKFPVHNQFIDFLLKYGVLGLLSIFLLIFYFGYSGIVNKQPIIIYFCLLFFLSNLTDDFLILYSGISFSSFWFSVFGNYKIKNS